MGQPGFWDEERRTQRLQRKKPTLATLSEAIPWEAFRSLIEQGYSDERKSNTGRKRTDPIIRFMMLVLQQLFNLSDGELKSQVNDRRSFEDFVGLGVMNTIPDATTIAFFPERIRKAGVILEPLERFEGHLRSQGLEARGWQIVYATLVPVPKQRNSREESYAIKDGAIPGKRLDKPYRLHQRGADSRWVKKNGISHYGYKNSICIDASHGFIRRFAITPTNIHDCQMLPQVLDPESRDDYVWADSGYAGARFEDLLDLGEFESCIHEKGARSHPLSEQAQVRNKVRSKVWARVEHVFAAITTCMRGKLTRRIGLARMRASWGLRNLTDNLLRYLHCNAKAALVV